MILDLFAGAGGAGIGIRRVFPDYPIVHVDHDPDCCATLRAAVGNTDLVVEAAVAPENLPAGTVFGLWASPPCQPYSHAGKRLQEADTRDAWPDTLRVVDSTRPAWVVVENVRGSPAERWAAELRDLGYGASVWDLDAADYGVPQHRNRRFVVARKRALWPVFVGVQPPHATHGPLGTLFGPARVSIGAALPHLRSEAIAAWEEAVRLGIVPRPAERPAWWHRGSLVDEPSRAIGGQANASVDVSVEVGGSRGGPGGKGYRYDRLDAPSSTVTTAGDARPHIVLVMGGGQNPHYPGEERRELDITDRPSTTIARPSGNQLPRAEVAARYPIGAGRAGTEPERLDRPAPTVTAQEVKGTRASKVSGWTFHGGPDRASDGVFLAVGRRRLTWAECARLQDFPADWPFRGTKTSIYRQVGNACPPTLAEVVVRALTTLG